MASAAEFLTRLDSVTKITRLREMVYEEILENEHILKDIKEEEYETGNIYGNDTKRTYAQKSYAEYKFDKNPKAGFGNVDLINTGSFIDSFKLDKPKQDRYKWNANDSKKGELIEMYGDDIMGMNQETFEKFQLKIIKPRFIKKLKSIING